LQHQLLGKVATWVNYDTCCWTRTVHGNTITWRNDNLPPYSSGSLFVSAIINPELHPKTVLTNNSTISYQDLSSMELDTSDNIYFITNTVTLPAPDIRVVKWLNDGFLIPDQQVTYEIFWKNEGALTANNVLITDTLPISLTYVSSIVESCTPYCTPFQVDPVISGNIVAWSLGDVQPAVYGYIYLTVQVDPQATPGSTIINTAQASISPTETDTSDNIYFITDTVTSPAPDMTVDKWLNDGFLNPGQQVTYDIYWENYGSLTASNVWITDTLPISLTYVSSTIESCTPYCTSIQIDLVTIGNTVAWNLGEVQPGWWGDIYLTVQVNPLATIGTTITNTVQVNTIPGEVDTEDNIYILANTITSQTSPAPDMTVYKWLSDGLLIPGLQVTYGIYWSNEGARTANNIWIIDALPVSLTYVSYSGESCTPGCAPIQVAPVIDGNAVSWKLGNVQPGWYGYIYLTVQVYPQAIPGTNVSNVVEVFSKLYSTVSSSITVHGPEIQAVPDPLDLGTSYLGYPRQVTLLVKNTDAGQLQVTNIIADSALLTVFPKQFSVPAGGKVPVTVTFTPTSMDPFSATLTLASNDYDTPSLVVPVTSNVLERPIIGIIPDHIENTVMAGTALTRTVSISNTGSSDLSYQMQLFQQDSGSVKLDVAVLGAEHNATRSNDVVSKIQASGQFESVTFINVANRTPTLAELQAYQAVLVFSYNSFANAIALGNVLADYVDWGGGVVVMHFALQSGDDLHGRFQTSGYMAIDTANSISQYVYAYNYLTLGYEQTPDHPVLLGVDSFDAGYYGYHSSAALTPGAIVLAEYSNGQPLVVEKTIQTTSWQVRRIDLNFFPVSSDAYGSYWISSTNGARLMANALTYVAVPTFVTVTPASGTIPNGTTQAVQVKLNATDLITGTYTADLWINNNDPANPSLKVPVTLHVGGTPSIVITPTLLNFGNTYLGYPKTLSIQISNTGTSDLWVNSIDSNNSFISINPSTFTIPIGGAQNLTVSYAPATVESLSAILTITSNDPDTPTFTVNLTGTALEPPIIQVNPEQLEETVFAGEILTRTLVISNTNTFANQPEGTGVLAG